MKELIIRHLVMKLIELVFAFLRSDRVEDFIVTQAEQLVNDKDSGIEEQEANQIKNAVSQAKVNRVKK